MRILIGKVRSGKTALMISEIRETVALGNGRVLFIVPEQYSHEAERELCAACGDRFSRCAEVMSFSGLARYSMSVHGGLARSRMDKAGKLLCLAAALREIRPVLRVRTLLPACEGLRVTAPPRDPRRERRSGQAPALPAGRPALNNCCKGTRWFPQAQPGAGLRQGL